MFHCREINRNINYMKDPYTLSIEIAIALSRIYLRRISLSVFTMETSRVWPLKSERKPFQYNNQWYFSYLSIKLYRVLNYNLRLQIFLRNNVNTTKFGLNSLRYCASKVWSMIPIEIKNSSSVEMFKNKINGSQTTVTANFV